MQFNNYIIDTLRHSSMQILRVCVHLMSCYLSFSIREIDGERERYPFNPYCACALVCRCVHLYILIEFSYAHLLQLPSFHTSFQHHLSLFSFISYNTIPLFPFLQPRSWGLCSERKVTHNAKLSGYLWWFTFSEWD